ncbi:MAG: hypothetical protein V4692_10170, partial [Bdellovibrionota bacterium]
AAAFGFVQSFTEMSETLGPLPDMLILASPKASNSTDRSFAQKGASSPSKFVHTLPNVRGAPLLQVMAWGGPVLCLQNGSETVLAGIDQAIGFLETDADLNRIWVVSFIESALENEPSFEVHYFVLSKDSGSITLRPPEQLLSVRSDRLWLEWVCTNGSGSFNLSNSHSAVFLNGGS